MNGEQHKNGRFDWRTIGVTAAVVIGGQLVQWGIFSATLAQHERRLDLIEKLEREQYLPREEFERRYEDMSRRVEENRQRIQEIEAERLAELQNKRTK